MELGRALNKVEDLRLIADYTGDLIGKEEATWAVAQARAFVQVVQNTFPTAIPKEQGSDTAQS